MEVTYMNKSIACRWCYWNLVRMNLLVYLIIRRKEFLIFLACFFTGRSISPLLLYLEKKNAHICRLLIIKRCLSVLLFISCLRGASLIAVICWKLVIFTLWSNGLLTNTQTPQFNFSQLSMNGHKSVYVHPRVMITPLRHDHASLAKLYT